VQSSASWCFQEKILAHNNQQSTWMALEDGGSVVVALEDGDSAAGLEGGVGRQFKIAAAAFSSSGNRRT
jgi:hypothetical protein